MIIAVVGSRGFIGSALAQGLSARGCAIRRLDRRNSWDGKSYDLAAIDTDWRAGLQGVDVVLNAGGMAHDTRRLTPGQTHDYQAVNADGVGRLAAAATETGVKRLVHLSTIKVLGEQPVSGDRFTETDALAPVGTYAETKAEGERQAARLVCDSDTALTVLRLPLVIGTPFKGNLATMEALIRRGVPLPVGHRSIGSRTYVLMPDLLDLVGVIVASKGPLPTVLHARSAPDLSAAELAVMVGERIGRRPRIVSVRPSILMTTARLLGSPETASKICDSMLVDDTLTRTALGLRVL